MKTKLKRIFISAISFITILTLFSCGVKTKDNFLTLETTAARAAAEKSGFGMASAKTTMNSVATVEDAVEYIADEYGLDVNALEGDKKIIKTVDINAETKKFDEALNWLKNHVAKYDGSIDNSYVDSGNMNAINYSKSAYYSVRIPAESLDKFLNEIGDNLNVIFKNENTQDVTDEYDDTESRIETLKIEEEKLNELMSKAKNVEDMIKIESKLSEVRSELRNITRRLSRLDKKIAYSTVNISISEVKDLTDVKTKTDDYSKENIVRQLKKNFEETKKFLMSVGFKIITNLPTIIVVLVGLLIIMIFVAIFRAIFGPRNETSEKKESNGSKDNKKSEVNKESEKSSDEKVVSEKKEDDEKAEEVEVEFYEATKEEE